MIKQFRVFFYIHFTLFFVAIFARDSYICLHWPKLVVLSFGFCFCQLAAKMLYKTISNNDYFNQDTLINNIYFALLIISILLKSIIGVFFIDLILFVGFFTTGLNWIIYLVKITNELAEILGIYIFNTKKREYK